MTYSVLAVASALEPVSWPQARRQVHREAAAAGRGLLVHSRHGDDHPSKTVLYEDTAALVGLPLAFAGVGMHQLTGSVDHPDTTVRKRGRLRTGVERIPVNVRLVTVDLNRQDLAGALARNEYDPAARRMAMPRPVARSAV